MPEIQRGPWEPNVDWIGVETDDDGRVWAVGKERLTAGDVLTMMQALRAELLELRVVLIVVREGIADTEPHYAQMLTALIDRLTPPG